MKKIAVLFLSLLFVFLGFSTASATSLLDDWAFNVDGTIAEFWEGDSMPTTGTLDGEGLGTLTWSTSAAGIHSFIAFFDHEIDQATTTYFNEYGVAVNTPEATQSWEIDEPGYVFGDIYEHVTGWNGTDYSGTIGLDNTNAVPATIPDDVSWAMGWDFTLAALDVATIKLNLAETAPLSGFYLSQTDPDSNATIYFSSTLDIQPIPEPGTMILLGTGLAGLIGLRRKKFSK